MLKEGIEHELFTKMSFDYSRLSELEETDTVEKELKNARNIDEVKLDICATPKEIYFAHLKDELNKGDILNSKTTYNIDKKIISSLYKSDMDYMQIIECMTYSPSYRQLEVDGRWIMASTRVTDAINPLLALPDIKFAKQLRHYQLPDFILENTKQIYHSYLKTVLKNDPEKNIKEADAQIVQSLQKLHLDNDKIKQYIEHSPQFLQLESISLQENLLLSKEKAAAVQQFLEKTDKGLYTKITSSSEPDRHDDDELIQTMHSHLEKLREDAKNKKTNLKDYWENVNSFLKEMMLQVDQAKIATQVLDQWVTILEKSSQTFQIEMDQDLKKMKGTLIEIKKDTHYEERWEFIYDLATKATSFSEKMMNELKRRDNPLLKLPEVITAKELNTLKNTDPAKSAYFSALKSILKENPKVDITSANKAIFEILTQKQFSNRKISDSLNHAPNLQGMTPAKKTIYVHTLMKEAKNHSSEINR